MRPLLVCVVDWHLRCVVRFSNAILTACVIRRLIDDGAPCGRRLTCTLRVL